MLEVLGFMNIKQLIGKFEEGKGDVYVNTVKSQYLNERLFTKCLQIFSGLLLLLLFC